MLYRTGIVIVGLCVNLWISFNLLTADAREWTSRKGTKVQAELVDVVPDAVVLDVDGKETTLPVVRLSIDDQQFLKSRLKAKDLTDVGNRQWTDSVGNTMQATLVAIKPAVLLKHANGRIQQVAVTLLSDEDQRYIESLADEPAAKSESVVRRSDPGADTPSLAPAPGPPPVRKPVVWTMNPDELITPDTPLSGTVQGQSFRVNEAELQDGKLVVRGGSSQAGRTVVVHLFAKSVGALDSKSWRMPGEGGLREPVVKLSWNEGGQTKTDTYLGNYAMALEFEQPDGEWLPGKLYLCLPDVSKSFVAGKFAAKVVPPNSP